MTTWKERAERRFHTRLTRNLHKAQVSVKKAETDLPHITTALNAARRARAAKQLERAMEELLRYEREHPEDAV